MARSQRGSSRRQTGDPMCGVLRWTLVRLAHGCPLLLVAAACTGTFSKKPTSPAALLPAVTPTDGRTRVIFRLDNGLEVVLEENHAAPVVAFQAWGKVGSAHEPPELAGLAH